MIKNSDFLPYVEDVFTISRDRFNISQNIKKSFDPKRILKSGENVHRYINGNSFFKRTIKRPQ